MKRSMILLVAVLCLVTGSVQAKDLVLAIGGESRTGYDPTLGWGRYGNPLFQSTLLKRDAAMKVVPDLARSWKLKADKVTWMVTIRDDAKFSDGTPVTVTDVAYTFNTARHAGGSYDMTELDEAVVTGPYSLELRLKEPRITFVHRLITLGIVPEHLHGPDYARNPVGSGPYTLVRWAEGEHMVVAANPLYYGTKPTIKRVIFLFTDEETSFAAAKAGQVDVVAVPPALAVQKLPGMSLHPVISVDNRGIMFPCVADEGRVDPSGGRIGNDVTRDPALRKAINMAIDRGALVAGVLEGYGRVAYGMADDLPWDESTARIDDGDPVRAMAILEAAGWHEVTKGAPREKNGVKAVFPLVYPASDSTRQALALASADMMRQVGIYPTVIGKSWDEIKRLNHSCAILFGWGSHNPVEMYNLYHSSLSGQGHYNAGYYVNPVVDAYLDAAMAADSVEASLPFWKKSQWDGETGTSARGDAPWAWLVNLTHTYFVKEGLDVGVSQIEPHGHGWPITANITEWRWR